jgi:fatty acid desaturase
MTIAGFWLASQPALGAWLAGEGLLALAFVQWFVLLHECGHETLFRTRRLHGALGHVAGFFAMIPFACWRRVHYRHHKWTGWQDLDPTTAALVPRPLGRLERALVNTCWKHWIPIFSLIYRLNNFWNPARLWGLFAARPEARRTLIVNIVLLGLVYTVVLAVVGPAAALRSVGMALVAAFVIEDVLLLSQHTHVPMHVSGGRDVHPFPALAQEPFTRSLRLPGWLSWLWLRFDAHELHHMYPFVPGHRLAEVPYTAHNEVSWRRWVLAARAVPGEVFLFQNRNESGFDI